MEQNLLRKLMKERRAELDGMTQLEAAKLAGVNKATWNRWESEGQTPREEVFPAIARALGLKVEELRRAVLSQWKDLIGEASVLFQLNEGPPEDRLAGYRLRNAALNEIGQILELDLASIEDAKLQLYLSDWRAVLRAQLVNADVLLQSLQSSVAIYKRFVLVLLGLPKTLFRTGGKRGKVRRKPAENNSKDGEECE